MANYDIDGMINRFITLVIFAVAFAALTPTVLTAFTNISSTGIVFATVISTIGGILLGVFALKGVLKYLKA